MYGLVWLVWLLRFRKTILRTPYLLLMLAFVALGTSIVIDIGEFVLPTLAESTSWMKTTLVVAEGLAKLAGILLLTIYGIVTSVGVVRGTVVWLGGTGLPPEDQNTMLPFS